MKKLFQTIGTVLLCIMLSYGAAAMFSPTEQLHCTDCTEGVIHEGKTETQCLHCEGVGHVEIVGDVDPLMFWGVFGTLILSVASVMGYTKGVHLKIGSFIDFSKSNGNTKRMKKK